jgi:hypothetical protein
VAPTGTGSPGGLQRKRGTDPRNGHQEPYLANAGKHCRRILDGRCGLDLHCQAADQALTAEGRLLGRDLEILADLRLVEHHNAFP